MINKTAVLAMVCCLSLSLSGCMTGAYAVANAAVAASPNAAAHSLVEDMGLYPSPLVYHWGDAIIPPLRKDTNNFADINAANSLRIAMVLARNESEMATQLGDELYARSGFYQKLVGAAIVASRHRLPPQELQPGGFIYGILKKYAAHDTSGNASENSIEVSMTAMMAMQSMGGKDALPIASEVVQAAYPSREIQAQAADVLGKSGDPAAVSALEAALLRPDVLAKHEIFTALATYSKEKAIAAAITNFPEKSNVSGGYRYRDRQLVDDLSTVTGQNFGMNKERWQQWLAAEKN